MPKRVSLLRVSSELQVHRPIKACRVPDCRAHCQQSPLAPDEAILIHACVDGMAVGGFEVPVFLNVPTCVRVMCWLSVSTYQARIMLLPQALRRWC